MGPEEQARSDYNSLSLHEREFIGRFMDYERLKVLRQHRQMAALCVRDLDAEINRCVKQLGKWPRHTSLRAEGPTP